MSHLLGDLNRTLINHLIHCKMGAATRRPVDLFQKISGLASHHIWRIEHLNVIFYHCNIGRVAGFSATSVMLQKIYNICEVVVATWVLLQKKLQQGRRATMTEAGPGGCHGVRGVPGLVEPSPASRGW